MASLVSFIVINWNGGAFLVDCLSSIRKQSYSPAEILVVDNGSTDHSREILTENPDVTTILNDTNRGFGPANNQALALANGEFIAFVNNDTVLDSGWLEQMMNAMLRDDRTGMCAGKTLSYSQPGIIDNTGHLLYWDGVNRGRGRMQEDHGQFDSMRDAFFPSGCACLFRASALQQVGTFDEEFYLYGDDTELGLRARLAGWDCAFAPGAVAYHRYSASSAPYHPMKFFFVERNRFWVAVKYFPIELLMLNPLFSSIRWLFHLMALFSGKGVSGEFARRESPIQLFKLWMKAQVSGWKGIPRFWRKRRDLWKKHGLSRRRFYQCFLPHRIGVRELTFTS